MVPLLRWLARAPVLFYCHFPDLLLAQRRSALHSAYRAPLDWVEQQTTGAADAVIVNSRFTQGARAAGLGLRGCERCCSGWPCAACRAAAAGTAAAAAAAVLSCSLASNPAAAPAHLPRRSAGIFAQTFSRLAARGVQPGVLYPAVSIPSEADLAAAAAGWRQGLPPDLAAFCAGGPTLLSINRFERKKVGGLCGGGRSVLCVNAAAIQAAVGVGRSPRPGCLLQRKTQLACSEPLPARPHQHSILAHEQGIGLAIEALAELRARGARYAAARLVVAGGYDPRLPENVEHLAELQALAEERGVAPAVRFLPSFTDEQRAWLLAAAAAVLYTPQHEHFGIVPLEAMAAARPVVACDSGGPRESVVSGRTGYLCPPEAAAWADAMAALLAGGEAAALGAAARKHVGAKFSRAAFGQQLNERVVELAEQRRQQRQQARRRRA